MTIHLEEQNRRNCIYTTHSDERMTGAAGEGITIIKRGGNVAKKSESAKLIELMTMLEGLGTLVTAQMIKAFVVIAAANEDKIGLNMVDLGNRMGLASSTRTKIIQGLSVRRGGDGTLPGLDLVVTIPDPDDVRARLILLTPKGRRLWASLKSIVGD